MHNLLNVLFPRAFSIFSGQLVPINILFYLFFSFLYRTYTSNVQHGIKQYKAVCDLYELI